MPNGAIYLGNVKYLKYNFFTTYTMLYEMDAKSSIDIDTIDDVKKLNNFQ